LSNQNHRLQTVDERPNADIKASRPGEPFLDGDGKTKKVSYYRNNIYHGEAMVHCPGCIELTTADATKNEEVSR